MMELATILEIVFKVTIIFLPNFLDVLMFSCVRIPSVVTIDCYQI